MLGPRGHGTGGLQASLCRCHGVFRANRFGPCRFQSGFRIVEKLLGHGAGIAQLTRPLVAALRVHQIGARPLQRCARFRHLCPAKPIVRIACSACLGDIFGARPVLRPAQIRRRPFYPGGGLAHACFQLRDFQNHQHLSRSYRVAFAHQDLSHASALPGADVDVVSLERSSRDERHCRWPHPLHGDAGGHHDCRHDSDSRPYVPCHGRRPRVPRDRNAAPDCTPAHSRSSA